MEANIPGVIAGHHTIYQQPADDSDGEIEAVVIDDFGANRYATIVEPQPNNHQQIDTKHAENN